MLRAYGACLLFIIQISEKLKLKDLSHATETTEQIINIISLWIKKPINVYLYIYIHYQYGTGTYLIDWTLHVVDHRFIEY